MFAALKTLSQRGEVTCRKSAEFREEITCVGRGRSMVPTRYGRFFAFLKKGVWRSCAAVGLNIQRAVRVPRKYVKITGRREPERRIFRKATLYNFLKRPGIFVHAAFAIEGWWCPLHAVNGWKSDWHRQCGKHAPRFDGIGLGCGVMKFRAIITHICKSTVREDSRDRGARPCASSRAVMPKDHISALESY